MKRTVHSVREQDSVLQAAQLMRDQDIGFLPVLDRQGKSVIGILTDRDIVIRSCASSTPPCGEDLSLHTAPVSMVMTRSIVACRPDDSLSRVEALMRQHRITRVVIIDEKDALVGVVSLSDLAPYESASRIGHTVQSVAQRKYAPERP